MKSSLLALAVILGGCGPLVDARDMLLQGSGTSGKQFGEADHSSTCSARAKGPGGLISGCLELAEDLVGSIRSDSGSQAVMQGWNILATGRGHRSARLAQVDAAGLYKLRQVAHENEGMTLTLLTPDFVRASVLSIPPARDTYSIRQYFKTQRSTLPLLIDRGRVLNFQAFDGITVLDDAASDSDGDGIPDGAFLQSSRSANIDTDNDGIPNEDDDDIDGDGLANVIDTDDNGNAILDVFDGDANGDLVNDTAPGANDTDSYFSEGLEYAATQLILQPRADGSGVDHILKVTAKVRDGVDVSRVGVRGAPALLSGATVHTVDAAGQPVALPWDGRLLDDGMSDDSNAGDRLYARKIYLEGDKLPVGNVMLFVTLTFDQAAGSWDMDFPQMFPNLKFAVEISAQYGAPTSGDSAGTVHLIGSPYGDIQDFIWTIDVINDRGTNIWQSQAIPGSLRQFEIQKNVMEPGAPYQFDVCAQSLDKVPGYPGMRVCSPRYDIVP